VTLARRHDDVGAVSDASVLLVCLDGWVDAGQVLDRVRRAVLDGPSILVAEFDTDMIFDYRSRRPMMHVNDGVNTGVDWPSIEVRAVKDLDGGNVLVLAGSEPDRGWRTFASEVLDIAQDHGVRMVVSLGAYPASTPHTREVTLSAIGTTPALVGKVGFLDGKIDTPAGVQAAIERGCADRRIPSVGLWAPVPHYAASEAFPPAVYALLDGLARIADRRFDLDPLISESVAVLERLDATLRLDAERARIVGNLESHADTVASAQPSVVPTGDELARHFEEYLEEEC
jgi:predicted ATP-grasp superfamily ATP-dependent carboligase